MNIYSEIRLDYLTPGWANKMQAFIYLNDYIMTQQIMVVGRIKEKNDHWYILPLNVFESGIYRHFFITLLPNFSHFLSVMSSLVNEWDLFLSSSVEKGWCDTKADTKCHQSRESRMRTIYPHGLNKGFSSSVWHTQYKDRYLKKAGRYNGRNGMSIATKMLFFFNGGWKKNQMFKK